MICTNCGAEIKLGAKFCGNCGTPITPEQEEIRDSNQKIKAAKSDYSSDWSNESQSNYPSDWSNEKYDPKLARSKKYETSQKNKDNKKGFYIFILILTPIVFFVKGGGIYGLTYTMTQSLILLAITSIPIKILRLVLFIIFGFFFLVSGLTPP